MVTGRNFAAIPKSASHTSPGLVVIDEVHDFLLDLARPKEIKPVLVSRVNDFRNALSR